MTDCGSCGTGYQGLQCTELCEYGISMNQICDCYEGVAGYSCQLFCPGLLPDGILTADSLAPSAMNFSQWMNVSNICSGHGQCSEGQLGNGSCSCDSYYYTWNCSVFCNASFCFPLPSNLPPVTQHQQCNPTSGIKLRSGINRFSQ